MADILGTYPKARTSEADDAFDKAKRENGYTSFKGHDQGGGTVTMPKGMTSEQKAKWLAGLKKGQAAVEGQDYGPGLAAEAGEYTAELLSPYGDYKALEPYVGPVAAGVGAGALTLAAPKIVRTVGSGVAKGAAKVLGRGGDEAAEATLKASRKRFDDQYTSDVNKLDDLRSQGNLSGEEYNRAKQIVEQEAKQRGRQRAIDRARKEGMTPEEAFGPNWEQRLSGVEARGTTEPKHRRMQTPQEAAEIEAARGPRGTVINPPETPMAKSIRQQRQEMAGSGGLPGQTILESAEGVTLSRNNVLMQLREHGAMADQFFEEMGDKTSYDAQDVLLWLGY